MNKKHIKNNKALLLSQLKNPCSIEMPKTQVFSYGALEFFKEQAKLPDSFKNYVHIPHSIWTCIPKKIIKKTEMWHPGFTRLIVHNNWDKKILKGLIPKSKKVITIPHPFYFLKKKYGETKQYLKKGTVIFYPHGLSKQTPPPLPIKNLVSYCRRLPKKFKPLNICFHFNDWDQKINKYLKKNNITPISAGEPNDKYFLHRLYLILDQNKNVISFDHGTQNLLAFICNCRVVYEKKLKVLNFYPPNYYPNYDLINPSDHFKKFFILIQKKYNQKKVTQYVHKLLGKKKLPSQEALKKIFYQAKKDAIRWRLNKKICIPPILLGFFYSNLYLKIRAVKDWFALRLLARSSFYVNTSYMIDEVIFYNENAKYK